MHLGQHCPNKCSYSIDEKLYSKTVLFICTATSKLAELVHVCILFYAGAYIKDEPCEEDKDRPISGPDVSCVSVIAPWPGAYGSSKRLRHLGCSPCCSVFIIGNLCWILVSLMFYCIPCLLDKIISVSLYGPSLTLSYPISPYWVLTNCSTHYIEVHKLWSSGIYIGEIVQIFRHSLIALTCMFISNDSVCLNTD